MAPPRRVPDVYPPGYDPPPEWAAPDPAPPAKVPFKFPQGARLRPYVELGFDNDRVSFTRAYL